MSIIIKKFGGTSVGTTQRIKEIALHLAEKSDDKIIVVVSAMGNTTNHLLSMAYQITDTPNQREMDMLITAGERITMALLSLSLQVLGKPSISFTGSQSGIITDNSHGNAKILSISPVRIPIELEKGKIVIVAGFQGVSLDKEITTLGRGGSDTTAVALACFLQADKCEIFTDVDGVYTADPRVVENAKKIKKISYEEMLYMAYTGSKVLHSRAVEFAYKYYIPIEVKSSENYKEGTMIDKKIEESFVKTLSHKENIIMIEAFFQDDKIPLITIDIFDMEYVDGKYRYFIEKKYKSIFLNQIGMYDNKTENNTEYCFINLLGYRICRDISFFYDLSQTLKSFCKQKYSIKNQGIGVQITIEQEEAQYIINELNKKYLLGGE